MADPIVETTMFDRHFDGMAGESDMPRKLVARLCWLKRAEIADRQNAELLAAARKAIMFAAFAKEKGYPVSDIYEVLDAAIENYSDEVVV